MIKTLYLVFSICPPGEIVPGVTECYHLWPKDPNFETLAECKHDPIGRFLELNKSGAVPPTWRDIRNQVEARCLTYDQMKATFPNFKGKPPESGGVET